MKTVLTNPSLRACAAASLGGHALPLLVSADIHISNQSRECENAIPSQSNLGRRKGRVRQHVNPLSAEFQLPISLDANWLGQSFLDQSNEFVVDVGCGKGNWTMVSASRHPDRNYLGLEIRRPIVSVSLAKKHSHLGDGQKGNIHFLSANANIDLPRVLRDIAAVSRVSMICFHHPDPLFKKKHKKRAVVTPKLVQAVADLVTPGCKVYLQTDVVEVMAEMRQRFGANAAFRVGEEFTSHPATATATAAGAGAGAGADAFVETARETEKETRADMGSENEDEDEDEDEGEDAGSSAVTQVDRDTVKNASPHDVPTDREAAVMERGLPIYRYMFVRT